jgi:hypothetical protein
MAQFVQKTGLEKNLRLFVKKHQTLEAYNSENMHPNIFWTTFLELEDYFQLVPRKILCKIDPNIICQLILKNGYQTPNTPQRQLGHPKISK